VNLLCLQRNGYRVKRDARTPPKTVHRTPPPHRESLHESGRIHLYPPQQTGRKTPNRKHQMADTAHMTIDQALQNKQFLGLYFVMGVFELHYNKHHVEKYLSGPPVVDKWMYETKRKKWKLAICMVEQDVAMGTYNYVYLGREIPKTAVRRMIKVRDIVAIVTAPAGPM